MPRSTRLGLLVAIFAGLLAAAPPLADGYVLVKLLALAAGGALAWIGLFGSPLRRTCLDGPLAALWAVMLLSAAASADPAMSVLGAYPQAFHGLIPIALYTALYYAAANTHEAWIDRVLGWMVTASIPLALYGLSQRVWGDMLTHAELPNHRISSTIGNPVMLGACIVILLPLALHWTLKKKSLLGVAAGAALLAALLETWARGAWLGAAVSAAAYLRLTGRLRPRPRHALALVLLSPLLFLALQRGLGKGDSDSMRVEIMKSSLHAFASRPILGWGPDAFMLALRRHKTYGFIRLAKNAHVVQSSAHNDLIQAAVTLGLLGLLAYAWLLWALAARFARLRSGSDGGPAAVAAALLGLFVQAKFNPVPPSALALAALMAGLVCRGSKPLAPAASRAAASLAAVFCAACALLLARFCAADRLFRQGQRIVNTTALADPSFMAGVGDLRRASELNPWLLDYLSQRCDVMFRVSGFASKEQGRQLIEKSLLLTAEAVRLHPGNPMAHELRATALALASRFGAKTLQEALREIKTASELDPTFIFTLRRRMEIASALDDRDEFSRAQEEYLRVIKLTGDSAQWPRLL